MILLPDEFRPGRFDVICARGNEAKNHHGNVMFRKIVRSFVPQYSQATSRFKKSMIVSQIVDAVRQQSPDGGFVKEEAGHWYEVGTHLAREKVGQSFRNLLHGQYKSSTKSKRRRKKQVNINIEAVVHANEEVSQRMAQLANAIQMESSDTSDVRFTCLFTQANCDLLQSFKKDKELQRHVYEQVSLGSMSDGLEPLDVWY